MRSVSADVLQGACIAVIVVDATHLSAVISSCAFDVDVAVTLRIALLFLKVSQCSRIWPEKRVSSENSYVSTRSVDLSIVFSIEVDDLMRDLLVSLVHWTGLSEKFDNELTSTEYLTYIHRTAAIVLDDLVAGMIRSTANDPGLLPERVAFLGSGQYCMTEGHT